MYHNILFFRVSLDLLVQRVRVVLKERVVCRVQEVFQVLLEMQVKEVLVVLLVLQALLDQLENQDQQEEEVCQVQMVPEDRKEHQETEE